MKTLIGAAAFLGLSGILLMVVLQASAADKDENTIKSLMIKAHKGDDSPLMKVDRGLGAEKPAWEELKTTAQPLSALRAELEKMRFIAYRDTSKYVQGVAGLEDALKKKDQKAALAAMKSIKGTCVACHKMN